MAEPLPPDPYAALGVPKDATSAAIKSAYRKAALRCHPDKAKGREDEFHRIQAAFEILGDDERRQKYDDTVYLESLKRNIFQQRRGSRPTNDARTASYDSRSAPHPSATFATRGPARYEERRPKPQYDDDQRYFDPEEFRASSRKYDGYEPSPKKGASRPTKPDIPRRDAKTPEKPTSKDRAHQKKQREKDTARERERKYSYAEDAHSDSDEDYVDRESRRSGPDRIPPRRRDGYEKHNAQAADAREHMNRARADSYSGEPGAPPPPPQFARSASYKEPEIGIKRVGKDQKPAMFKRSSPRPAKEKTPEPVRKSSGRDQRSKDDLADSAKDDRRPPPLQTHFSSPGPIPRDTRRTQTVDAEYDIREPPRPSRPIRSETMPTARSTRRGDTTPLTPSGLRNETHDSGYSTSSPSGSPPPPQFASTSTKYKYPDGAADEPTIIDGDPWPTVFREPSYNRMRQRSPEEAERAHVSPRRPAPQPSRASSFQPEPQASKSSRRPSVSRASSGMKSPSNLTRGTSTPLPKTGRGPNDPADGLLFGELRSPSPTEMFNSADYNRGYARQAPGEDVRTPAFEHREFLRRSSAGGETHSTRREMPRRSSEQHYFEQQERARAYMDETKARETAFKSTPRRQAAY